MGRNVDNKEKIFVIDDSDDVTKIVESGLEDKQIGISSFCTAEDALDAVRKTGTPDLFILALNLPKMNGVEFLQIIRREYRPTIPAIVISSEETTDDLIKSIDLGVDVFVKKLFSPQVLIAQVKASLRRYAVYSSAVERSIVFDDFVLLLNSNILKKGKKKIPLSAIEYGVLELLITNAGITMLPDRIYTEVWKAPFGDVTAVAVYIQRLRKKIESDTSSPKYIKTYFGKGYYFEKSVIFSQSDGSIEGDNSTQDAQDDTEVAK